MLFYCGPPFFQKGGSALSPQNLQIKRMSITWYQRNFYKFFEVRVRDGSFFEKVFLMHKNP